MGKNCSTSLLLYFPKVLLLELSLYGIVWYGTLMAAVFTLLTTHIFDVNLALKAIILWVCVGDVSPYVKPMTNFLF